MPETPVMITFDMLESVVDVLLLSIGGQRTSDSPRRPRLLSFLDARY